MVNLECSLWRLIVADPPPPCLPTTHFLFPPTPLKVLLMPVFIRRPHPLGDFQSFTMKGIFQNRLEEVQTGISSYSHVCVDEILVC